MANPSRFHTGAKSIGSLKLAEAGCLAAGDAAASRWIGGEP